MIYEIRTYDLNPRSVPGFEKRFGEKLPGRMELSGFGGLWHTEVGPLNQVIHIWPYEDLNQREKVRAEAISSGRWPPDSAGAIVNMNSEIMHPAPFMEPMGERQIGPLYEYRTYWFPPGLIAEVLDIWAGWIGGMLKYLRNGGVWYSEFGGLNKIVHMWGYKRWEERTELRAQAAAAGIGGPPYKTLPIKQESKILIPAECSPMQ